MTYDLVITLVVIAAMVALFLSEWLPLAATSVLALSVLGLAGVITPGEAFAGFSNSATVTVTAMFVLSAGMHRTGSMNKVGEMIGALFQKSWKLGLTALALGAAIMSAFINNTAVVAVLLPVVVRETQRHDLSPSKVLIPLSFASMFGGSCTLIGTSTNLLVSSVATDLGEAGIELFDLAPVGVCLVLVGLVYLVFFGPKLLPGTRSKQTGLSSDFGVSDYVTDLTIKADAPAIGKRIDDVGFLRDHDCEVITIMRDGARSALPPDSTLLRAGDTLRVRCRLDDLKDLKSKESLLLKPVRNERQALEEETVLMEAVLGPASSLAGESIGEIDLRHRLGAVALAVRHDGALSRDELEELVVRPGHALLLEVSKERIDELRNSDDFVVVSEADSSPKRLERMPVALAILVTVVASAAFDLAPISVAATSGAVAMVVTGCIRQSEAFNAIDWNVIFLLGSLYCVGTAVESSGAASLVGTWMVDVSGALGPTGLISVTYGVTALISSFLSNQATAVIFTPVAIAAATAAGIDARPLVMAVAFGASTSFATPVGYQTNALVYSAGNYRFVDFLRIGAPLMVIFWLVVTFLIPAVWPP